LNKAVFGLALASQFWPRPWPRSWRFVLGLKKMFSFNITGNIL